MKLIRKIDLQISQMDQKEYFPFIHFLLNIFQGTTFMRKTLLNMLNVINVFLFLYPIIIFSKYYRLF